MCSAFTLGSRSFSLPLYCSPTRTSYDVGRPWMFDEKMLRGLTGTPMRRIDLAKSVLADADPEPLTFANFTTKSLLDSIRFIASTYHILGRIAPLGAQALHHGGSERLHVSHHVGEARVDRGLG